jgi:hypothetical protein
MWAAKAAAYKQRFPQDDVPLYLTLSGPEGRDIDRFAQEGLVERTEVGGIAATSQHLVVAVVSSPIAVAELQGKFPGLKIVEQDFNSLIRGERLIRYPEGRHEQYCRARIVNLDLDEPLRAQETDGEIVFPVLSWIEKLAQLHRQRPRKEWCLCLTLHGEIHWPAEICAPIRDFLAANFQLAPTFSRASRSYLGVELHERIVQEGIRDFRAMTTERQQRLLMVLVPKKIAQLVHNQGWRLKVARSLRYGEPPEEAPMVTWIVDFEWDRRVSRNPNRIYVDTLDGSLDTVGYIAQDGTLQ